MSDPVKISSLELENVKRVRALSLEPTADGLTVIGGGNGQGKTSVLDAIAWALGGNRKKPDRPTREGSATPAQLRVELSNGIVVERKGKNGALTVTDPEGKNTMKSLQSLGFQGIAGVKTVKLFEVDIDAPADKAEAEAEEMCKSLLANPVIQNYRVTVR